MPTLLPKSLLTWLLLVVLATFNGFIREKLLIPWLGNEAAAPLSVLSLSLLILLATLVILPIFGSQKPGQYWLIGLTWLVMTVLFELLFGHYFVGESWEKMLESYKIWNGELWIVVLLVTLVAPYWAAEVRGIV